MNRDILRKLKSKKYLADGAWGTYLHKKGLKPGECPELWNSTNAKKVYEVAKSYVDAGSDIIETNSFGGSIIKLKEYQLGERCYELNKLAAEISRSAGGNDTIVFGSIGPTGKFIITGDVTEEELYESYTTQSKALEDGGADVICLETFYDLEEARISIAAAKENTSLPVACTFTFDKSMDGTFTTIMGVTPSEMAVHLKEFGADIIGTNCGNGLLDMILIVEQIKMSDGSLPLLVQSNAGLPIIEGGGLKYPEDPAFFISHFSKLMDAGADIIGGCCGTTPEHIAALRVKINSLNSGSK
ncbi:MAG: methionine synthase [Ignavibacteriae bacterium HGW-Ignavibacteriae-2]|jgi:5-methyltetrahydrofolate--homocysteine methyltransferase|nr:homocysteine S-methyltransferase family protein [Bacteroidota bacterium]PKL89809.1 MAG: methionine synthase [Ignavibacteriae bacterium HGW-Ignavibacteriae-2]